MPASDPNALALNRVDDVHRLALAPLPRNRLDDHVWVLRLRNLNNVNNLVVDDNTMRERGFAELAGDLLPAI